MTDNPTLDKTLCLNCAYWCDWDEQEGLKAGDRCPECGCILIKGEE